ncbi:hypothetical protein HDU85_003307 [Gaertneriomyces sp. JEL0708]|nr:hypothetical protein HDU85_003307 [Gaertneriomyces sp. JEL0708]
MIPRAITPVRTCFKLVSQSSPRSICICLPIHRVVCTSTCNRTHSSTPSLKASLTSLPGATTISPELPFAHPQPFISPPPLPPTIVPEKKPEDKPDDILAKTFYRRELPSSLHSFTSPTGRTLFRESLEAGFAEIYFSLSGNFTMQSEPAFCGLGSLAMVLNALAVDPGKRWKGVWRWYSDDMLECCAPLSQIKEKGMTFRELACLARCNGLRVVAKRADQITYEEFIEDLKKVTASQDMHMVVSFSRKTLNQTGDGHFSPIGAYHPGNNQALVLDTARFKYPSYFCDAKMLFEAMKPLDKETGLPRGYFILTKGETKPIALCKLNGENYNWPSLTKLFCNDLPQAFKLMHDQITLPDIVRHVILALPQEYNFLISLQEPGVDLAGPAGEIETNHEHEIQRLLAEAMDNPMFANVKQAMEASPQLQSMFRSSTSASGPISDGTIALATIFMLSAPREIFVTLPDHLRKEIGRARDRHHMGKRLADEVGRISEQIELMLNTYCSCGKRHQACRNVVPKLGKL